MKDLKPSIVFIAGLGHSGSTLLNFLLGSHPKIAGLGEIGKILLPGSQKLYMERYIIGEKYPCSCGKMPSDCPLWNPFSNKISNENLTFGEYYKELIKLSNQNLGSVIAADSSKNINALKKLFTSLPEIGVPRERFFVLHLVKDVRNLAVSNLRSKHRASSIRKSFKDWKKKNLVIESFLKKNNIQSINVGYEELAISTEYIMKTIADFIGVDSSGLTSDLNPEDSHVLFGNKMRLNDKYSNIIEYDYQWFTESKINFLYLISPYVRRLNNKWVYSNVKSIYSSNNNYTSPVQSI